MESRPTVKGCAACQLTFADPVRLEPLKMSEIPGGPWRKLSTDFLGPLPKGDYLMSVTVTCEYSRFNVVRRVASVKRSVIPVWVPADHKVRQWQPFRLP